ncbi:hypothetical protein U3A58_11175 [Algoriphagus sp. C2-6-M1]|uniref:hypothetical protein n=1 Tax=Algoriphagus persicinus TaxID=3108754 RepID=UPI002B3D1178|nr:hypothetical protein [Algoriphagus sp. C2-6-M1]MEB2780955.1 hypothetical protein [Algoriphagus sp. C2-6-M1]
MNTKFIMILSALFMYSTGVVFTFAPDVILSCLNLDPNQITLFIGQILGALYFGFGMLNWMSKGSLIGGIYNRPICIANLSHFLIAGLALLKGLASNPELPIGIWAMGVIYIAFGIAFGIILFRHPVAVKP